MPHMNENKCNCDARDPVQRSDEGFITNKVRIAFLLPNHAKLCIHQFMSL